MGSTLAQILPLAIGATFSPSGLLLVVGILSGKENPRRKALAFVLGSTLFLVVLGLIILLVFQPTVHASPHSRRISGIIDIVVAVLIVLMVVRSILTRKKKKKKKKKRRIPYGVVGFFFMLLNTSTLVLYMAACKIIAEDQHRPLGSGLLLGFLITITMFLVAFPVIITYAMPRRSERVLAPISSFMSKHGMQVANVYFLAMAAYLLVRGIRFI